MNTSFDPILRIPESIRRETADHRGKVARYLDGQTSEIAFRAYRVPMGIYEQRTTGKFMVRVRIGAGLVLADQLRRIAELSGAYGSGIIHLTTRQDIQIHDVNIENTPDVLEKLLEVGLSSRGGGGNTVRNVTACPRSGVCPNAQFDVAPYAVAAAEYMLADNSSFNLPRKYKIVFSACAEDCAFASVADLGFFAHKTGGVNGFSAYAAGGLGSNPAVAIKIEEFLPGGDIFEVAEAIKRVFDKHGDRVNRHKARLRYVVARLGVEKFLELYRGEREALKSDGLPYPAPDIRDIESRFSLPEAAGDASALFGVMPEVTSGRVTTRVRLKNGDISADDLTRVAAVAASYGQGLVRTTQLQSIFISGVACDDVDAVAREFGGVGLNTGISGANMVACTGAAMCKLGLCLSRGLADAIVDKLGAVEPSPDGSQTTIRISGCPNSCANHYLPEVAFQGRAKRIGGRLMPYYNVLTGAVAAEGAARLGRVVGSVPAKLVPDMVLEAWSDGKVDASALERLADKYGQVDGDSLPDDYYHDFGADEPFSLAGRGPGECGSGVMDVIRVDIDEAKMAIKSASGAEQLYKAVSSAARALLVTFGLEPGKDREIFAAFAERLIAPGWVKADTRQLLDAAMDWRLGDRESLDDLREQIEELVARVEELFLSLDASLAFRVAPIRQQAEPAAEPAAREVDLLGVACPMNFVKAKIVLEQVELGQVLEILLDAGEPVENVPPSFADQGQEVVEITPEGEYFRVKIRRKK